MLIKFAAQINNLAAQKNNFAAQKKIIFAAQKNNEFAAQSNNFAAQMNEICCPDLRQPKIKIFIQTQNIIVYWRIALLFLDLKELTKLLHKNCLLNISIFEQNF